MAIDVTIEKLIYGGDGLTHDAGATIFVPYVLPSERVKAEVFERKKKFARARVEEILSPSADRIIPRCPHFGVCGGCHYQHVSYPAQLRCKSDILRETLRRMGRIDWTGEISAHPSPEWGYRNRAQWKARALPEKNGRLAIGYFRPDSTALCAVSQCAILSPPLHAALLAFRDAAAAGALPKELREIEAFAAPDPKGDGAKLAVTATLAGFPSRAAELAAHFREMVPQIESLVFHEPARDRMELFGPGFVEYPLGDTSYRVGHFSFFQVNDFLVAGLAAAVAGGNVPPEGESDSESDRRGALAIDLFAGVGLFSLPLARNFRHVIAVESNPAAVRDLEVNARGNAAIEVRASDSERFLAKFSKRADLIVLDPPRAGLSPRLATRLAQVAPARIAYVSCEPPALARDLATLVASGYEITGIELFDLFPQTFHMETLVHLRRRP